MSSISGVVFERKDEYAICHVDSFSDELKELIRTNLTAICHGAYLSSFEDEPLYCYESTLESFIDRYKTKTEETKKGMIGEFLSHILITNYFDEFDIVSPFFNLEEKSIKKGFDVLLCNQEDNSLWITEVKSGGLHQNKDCDQTSRVLLNSAKADLNKRLNDSETMYWYNATNSVNCTLSGETDYKDVLLKIIRTEGGNASKGDATSHDNNVVLVSVLFSTLEEKITSESVKKFLDSITEKALFSRTIVFSMQKETYSKVADFILSESVKA